MQNKSIWKILAISFILLMAISCVTPSIAVDDLKDDTLNRSDEVIMPFYANANASIHVHRMPFDHLRVNEGGDFHPPGHSRIHEAINKTPRIHASNSNITLSSNTYYVNPGESIQDAVDNASAGDTIIARDGTYTENIKVNKDYLIVTSENGAEKTIVQAANPSDHVFEVTADYVNLSGFTVTGAEYWVAGVYIGDNNYCSIFDNIILHNRYGIALHHSSNNTLTNNTANSNRYGILLDYLCNNNTLTNNTANSNSYGIWLYDSSNNTLTNNTASSNGCGIYLDCSCNYNTLTNNTVNSNNHYGIHLEWGSDNNMLTNNTVNSNNYAGIYLCESSNNNTLTNNTFVNDGLFVWCSYQNTVKDNTVNGKPLAYLESVSDQIITEAGQVILVNCDNITAENLDLSNASVGVELWGTDNSKIINTIVSNNNYYYGGIYLNHDSSNNTLTNNTANSNNYYGIYLSSNNNTLTNNTANSNNGAGIYLKSSSNNTLTNNTANSNYYGICLYCSSNSNTLTNNTANSNYCGICLTYYYSSSHFHRGCRNNMLTNNIANSNYYGFCLWWSGNNAIYHNNLINNTNNVYSKHSTNIWNSTEKITYTYNGNTYTNYLGNYWDDYVFAGNDTNKDGIGDTPYPIDSDEDNYPLMERFENYIINETVNHHPNPPTNLAQLKSDSATEIPVGGATDERKVYFKGTVSDPDGDKVKLQVELRHLDEYGGQFNETKGGLKDSVLVENGSEAVAYADGLIDADYHWRARAVDEHGEPSEWVDFGNNNISEADFTVDGITYAYDAQAAVNYAEKHWKNYNSTDQESCDYYQNYSGRGGDCANFVSQCLIAGGLDLSGHPGANSYTCECIINCTNLHDYLVNYLGATWDTRYEGQEEPEWFKPGDPAIFGKSDEHNRTHAVIVVTKDATNNATYNSHDPDVDHRTINWFFDNYSLDRCTFYHIPREPTEPAAKPVLTSPLEFTPRFVVYSVREVITAQFTIANKGTVPIVFKVLTVGGRDPDGKVVDFDWQENIVLNPGASHDYIGNLILPEKTGTYHFFCTYQTEDGNWNTCVDLSPGLTDDDRAKRISVAETVIGPPREFVFEAVHLSSGDCNDLSKIVKEILTQEKSKLDTNDPKVSLINQAIVLAHRMENEQKPPRDPIREGTLTESQDFWLTTVGGEIVGFITGLPGVGEAAKQFGFDIAEALYLKDLGFVRMKQSGIGDITITYFRDKEGAIVSYQDPLGGVFISTPVKSKWVFSPISLIRKQLYLPDLESYSINYKEKCDITAQIKSPAELRVYDSQNRVTGLVEGEVKEEIPNSMYDKENNTVTTLFASSNYRYEVVGTATGTYGLTIISIEDGEATTFTATDIPTASGAVHQYTIDWTSLSHGEEGVTVQVDSDGGGVFEDTFTADGELTYDEFMLQTARTIDFDPDTLNLQSKGKWVTVYTELPARYNVTEINVSTMMLNETVPAELHPTEIGDYDSDGIADLMVKFNSSAVQEILEVGDEVEITVTGELTDGTLFEGSDVIRVIDKG